MSSKNQFDSGIIEQLDMASDSLSPEVTDKLRINRQAVLKHYSAEACDTEKQTGSGVIYWLFSARNWKPVLATALSVALLISITVQLTEKEDAVDPGAIELLVADEQLELFEQLEFYEWLSEQEQRQDSSVHNAKYFEIS